MNRRLAAGLQPPTPSSTWVTFEDATSAFETGKWISIGFVFSKDDPFCGIDLDKCFDPETGVIQPWAQKIITTINSYTERSLSGSGFHIIVEAVLPKGGNRKDGLEIYDQQRYFIMTGDHVSGTPVEIEKRQSEIETLHRDTFGDSDRPIERPDRADKPSAPPTDREILDRAFAARNGSRTQALWEGRWKDLGYPSQSEADLALCSDLAYWTGNDSEKTDHLFRQSCLMRPKWDEKRGDLTYGEKTIRAALNGSCDAVLHPPHNSVLRLRSPSGDAGEVSAGPGQTVEILPWVPFPVGVLPEPACEFVIRASEAIGCDPAFVALPLLSALAAAIGNARTIRLKAGWEEPAIIWAVVVAESGTLKTPALRAATDSLHLLQREAFDQFEQAQHKHKIEKLEYEKALQDWKRDDSGSGPPEEPEEPHPERLIVDDTTIEALVPLLFRNPKGLLLCSDELSKWLASFDRYTAGKGDAGHWLEMHVAASVTLDRKTGTSPTLYVSRASVSVTGGIQPGILKRSLGLEHRENGLLARLLIAAPPRRPKSWTESSVSQSLEEKVAEIFRKLHALAMNRNKAGELVPVPTDLSPQAKSAWVRFYNDHAREQINLEWRSGRGLVETGGICRPNRPCGSLDALGSRGSDTGGSQPNRREEYGCGYLPLAMVRSRGSESIRPVG